MGHADEQIAAILNAAGAECPEGSHEWCAMSVAGFDEYAQAPAADRPTGDPGLSRWAMITAAIRARAAGMRP